MAPCSPARAFVLRWFDRAAGDRLLAVNLGDDLDLAPAPEPLLAPPRDARWQMTWSSDDPRYGGPGALEPCGGGGWRLAAESAASWSAPRARERVVDPPRLLPASATPPALRAAASGW